MAVLIDIAKTNLPNTVDKDTHMCTHTDSHTFLLQKRVNLMFPFNPSTTL